MMKGFTNSTSSRWNADASELISSWTSTFSKEKLILTRLNSSSAHPEPVYEAHVPITARTKQSSAQERCLLRLDCEILEKTYSTSSLVTLSIFLQKNLDRNLPCSTCVTSLLQILTLNPRPAYVIIIGPRGHSYHS